MLADELHCLVEKRIEEAIERGEFRDLPGAGRPLELADLSRVPDDLRASYLLLEGANMLPPEMELKRDISRIDQLIAACTDEVELRDLRERRNSSALRFALLMERRGFNPALHDYAEKIAAKLPG
jgi:hypothetical protein